MFWKRAAAALLALCILTAPAFAHGHGRKGRPVRTESATCAVCTVEGCGLTGRHTHRGTTYCGYGHEGGFCDGTCYAVCPLEDCDLQGRHTHDGVTYCGYGHEGGFCDGTCLVAEQIQAPAAASGCHHHGGHHH